MTITQALVELNLLDSRITKQTQQLQGKLVSVQLVSRPSVTIDKDKTDAVSALQSLNALIENRKNIKMNIVKSNAVTKVTIAGVEMTVADAIERKSSINYERSLLMTMKSEYDSAQRRIDVENKKVELDVDRQIETIFAKADAKPEDIATTRNTLLNQRTVELVDHVSILDHIAALEKSIEDFLSEVDIALSISNATTNI
jgi:hypothetical protein